MKKLIVIASAIIAILFAVAMLAYSILYLTGKIPQNTYMPLAKLSILISLLIILISLLVVFNIKLPKSFRIILIIVSIPLGLLYIAESYAGLLMLYNGKINTLFDIRHLLIRVTIFITLLTYIRRALKPMEVKENK